MSCYYIHSNRNTRYIVFIRYENFMKVILSSYRTIILSIEEFMNIHHLFEYYLLSLVTTEHTDRIMYEQTDEFVGNPFRYGISMEIDWKTMYFTNNFRTVFIGELFRNPFNSLEPSRQTSYKKIRKFIKNFIIDFSEDPMRVLCKLIDTRCNESEVMIDKMDKILELKKNVNIFTGIKKGYGIDVYTEILKHM